MEINNSLGFNFLRTANNYRNTLEKKMNEIGLHYGQVSILILLWEKDGQSQIKLAKSLNLSQPTVNKMVKSLAKNGFIICNQCETDGRKMRVYLAPKGLAAQPIVVQQTELAQTVFFESFTDTEQLIFKQLCDKLGENELSKKND